MADEVRVQGPGPDGNGFSLDLREKKLGLTGPNVALLLLILIIGVVAYIRTGTIDKTMKAGQEQLVGTEARVHQRVTDLFGRIDKLLDDIQAQNLVLNTNNAKVVAGQHELRTYVDGALRAQDDRMHTQVAGILTFMLEVKKYIEDWFTEMARRDDIHDWNATHSPEQALPLRGPAPTQERGR